MILKYLSLTNYKNIESAELSFSDKLNCIIGSNGMGKTNLLDAIYYLSFTKSSVHLPDSMIIRQGADLAIIDGRYQNEGADESLYCGLRAGKSKVFRRNKKDYGRISEHIGTFPLVMISPFDYELIRGGSDDRRKFMDMIISQESPVYLSQLIAYRKLIEQRNSLLKQRLSSSASLLDVIDEQMAPLALGILSERYRWIERITPIFMSYYNTISDNADTVGIGYISSMGDHEGADTILKCWQDARERDFHLGYTSVGPHKDDIEMLLQEALIRKLGSQGQCKTFLIALKFAQYRLLRQLHPHNTPILLLDDVFDKLDAHRVDRIVSLVSGEDFGQIFMTDTNRKYLDKILSHLPDDAYSIFSTENGSFKHLKS